MANRKVIDMMKREVNIPAFPLRIVSLVPSQTELLHELGLDERVVGITKFCIHPKTWYESKNRIGGTKNIDIEKVRYLKPDLVIGNKEENEKSDIEALEKEFPVWMSDIYDSEDALTMIEKLGQILDKPEESTNLLTEIRKETTAYSSTFSGESVLYFIWKNPYMMAGPGTYIHHQLEFIGLKNLCNATRYPEITKEEIIGLNPEIIFLSSEPFPFTEKHIAEFQEMLPNAKIKIVDGEMFSWYGSRMKLSYRYFASLSED